MSRVWSHPNPSFTLSLSDSNYCSHRRTHIHTHTHARTQTHTHKYAHTHTNTLTHKCTHAPPPTHTHAYTGLTYTYNYMCRDLLVFFRAPTRFHFGNTAILKRRHKVWFSLPTARFVCARERQRERCCVCARTCVRVLCGQIFFKWHAANGKVYYYYFFAFPFYLPLLGLKRQHP